MWKSVVLEKMHRNKILSCRGSSQKTSVTRSIHTSHLSCAF
ncbi:hypothetical protein GDO81_003731 [Engystomops pustulosus]|uniref:Uncharacterized protein n=1 Tax=Engystomops pustulosus TaxID=76066 RepID=A0AAV6ZYS0_ENGPU|nr:hypothetical protein GDO81_003731 [Engystomops pustulosus]